MKLSETKVRSSSANPRGPYLWQWKTCVQLGRLLEETRAGFEPAYARLHTERPNRLVTGSPSLMTEAKWCFRVSGFIEDLWASVRHRNDGDRTASRCLDQLPGRNVAPASDGPRFGMRQKFSVSQGVANSESERNRPISICTSSSAAPPSRRRPG